MDQGYQPDQSTKALQRLPPRVTHAGPVAHACLSASARPAGGPALVRPPLSVSPGTSCHTPHTGPKLEFRLSYATGAEPRRWRVGSAGHTHASPRPPTTHRDPVEHPAGPDWAGACPAGADPAAPGGGVARLGPRGFGLFRRRRQTRPLLPSPAPGPSLGKGPPEAYPTGHGPCLRQHSPLLPCCRRRPPHVAGQLEASTKQRKHKGICPPP